MYKGSRNNDSCAKLLEYEEDLVEFLRPYALEKNRSKDANRAGGHDDKQETNTKPNVVVSTG